MAAQTTEEIKTERGEGESTGADVGNRITPTPGRGRTDFPTGTSGGQAFGPDMPLASKQARERERERLLSHHTKPQTPDSNGGASGRGSDSSPMPWRRRERERAREASSTTEEKGWSERQGRLLLQAPIDLFIYTNICYSET